MRRRQSFDWRPAGGHGNFSCRKPNLSRATKRRITRARKYESTKSCSFDASEGKLTPSRNQGFRGRVVRARISHNQLKWRIISPSPIAGGLGQTLRYRLRGRWPNGLSVAVACLGRHLPNRDGSGSAPTNSRNVASSIPSSNVASTPKSFSSQPRTSNDMLCFLLFADDFFAANLAPLLKSLNCFRHASICSSQSFRRR